MPLACSSFTFRAGVDIPPRLLASFSNLATLTLEKVYSYDPTPAELKPDETKYILGSQVNLWTEYVDTPEQAEYMTFPRACAMSEVTWTTLINKNFVDFGRRLETHFKRLDRLNVNYAKSIFDVKETATPNKNTQTVEVKLEPYVRDAQVRYTLDFSKPMANSPVFVPQTFNKLTTEVAPGRDCCCAITTQLLKDF